jgi:hypothetical protein
VRRVSVPRLDLTPVFLVQEQEECSGDTATNGAPLALPAPEPGSAGAPGARLAPLQLEWEAGGAAATPEAAGLSDRELEEFAETCGRRHSRSGGRAGGAAASAGRGGGRSGAARKAGAKAPAAKSGGGKSAGLVAAAAEEGAGEPQEAFYVYAPAVPKEEAEAFDEVRRALKARGRPALVSQVDGLWERYTEARRNCEAMAFRGHRLLDQVGGDFRLGGWFRTLGPAACAPDWGANCGGVGIAVFGSQASLCLAARSGSRGRLCCRTIDAARPNPAQRLPPLALQVSNEFGGYKREAEEKMEQLSGELTDWREQAELALSVVRGPGARLAGECAALQRHANACAARR